MIALTAQEPTSGVAVAGLVAIAAYYLGFQLLNLSVLKQVRFAQLVAHAITYVVVNGSYQLHATLRTLAGSDALLGDADFAVDPDWFGPTLAMAGFWSIGFAVHAVASVARRGFEN